MPLVLAECVVHRNAAVALLRGRRHGRIGGRRVPGGLAAVVSTAARSAVHRVLFFERSVDPGKDVGQSFVHGLPVLCGQLGHDDDIAELGEQGVVLGVCPIGEPLVLGECVGHRNAAVCKHRGEPPGQVIHRIGVPLEQAPHPVVKLV